MITFKDLDISSKVVSTVPCGLIRVEGYSRATTDKWLQFWDARSLADAQAFSDTFVHPVRSLPLLAEAPFAWSYENNNIHFEDGLVIAISDNEGAAAQSALSVSASKIDIMGEIEPASFMPTNYSVAGDWTTGVNEQSVFSLVKGPGRLFRLDLTNNEIEPVWFMLFDTDPNFGDVPLTSWAFPAGASRVLYFGDEGRPMAMAHVVSSLKADVLIVAGLTTVCTIRAFYTCENP